MKAVLVIDMPTSCGECNLKELYDSWECIVNGRTLKINCEKPRPSWCPLKPMPEKIFPDINSQLKKQSEYEIWTGGWNACLDSIIGEKNESNITN